MKQTNTLIKLIQVKYLQKQVKLLFKCIENGLNLKHVSVGLAY